MRIKIVLAAVLAVITLSAKGETSEAPPQLQPYFAAVIVRDLDSSIVWYQSVFGLIVKHKEAIPERETRLAILESSRFLVELIEERSSLERKKLLQKAPTGTNIQGHFKIGFKVADTNVFLRRLQALKIPVGKIYTDAVSKKRNFLINDPDGNLIQFFE